MRRIASEGSQGVQQSPHTFLRSLCCLLARPAPTSPLIGPMHQVFVPDFSGAPAKDAVLVLSATGEPTTMCDYFAGTTRWNPSLLVLKGTRDPEKKREAIDKYLGQVEALFYKDADRHFGQEQALFFLHQCEYNISKAINLLKPWQPPGQQARTASAQARAARGGGGKRT